MTRVFSSRAAVRFGAAGAAAGVGALLVYDQVVALWLIGGTTLIGILGYTWDWFGRSARKAVAPVSDPLDDWRLWAIAGSAIAYVLLGEWLVELGWIKGGLGAVNIALCVIGFVRGFRPSLRPIQTIWFAFQLSWLGIAPIYQISHGLANWGDGGVWNNGASVDQAFALNTVSSAVAVAAFSWSRRREPATRYDARAAVAGESHVARSGAWICAAGAAVLFVYVLRTVGGVGGLFVDRAQFGSLLGNAGISIQAQGGINYALVHILPGALAVAASLLFVKLLSDDLRSGGSARLIDLAGFGLSLVLDFLLNNPWSSARYVVAGALGSVVLAVWRPRTRNQGLAVAGLVLAAVLLIYPLANAFKSSHASGTLGWSALATTDFDGFQEWVNSINYVHAAGHSWGLHTLSALLYFVPRSIWHTKALPASLLVAQHAGYLFTNLSLPFQAEMYVEFGLLGMALAVAIVCALLGHADEAWVTRPQSKLAGLVPFAAVAVLPLIRGPLGGSVPFPMTVLMVLALAVRSGDARMPRYDRASVRLRPGRATAPHWLTRS